MMITALKEFLAHAHPHYQELLVKTRAFSKVLEVEVEDEEEVKDDFPKRSPLEENEYGELNPSAFQLPVPLSILEVFEETALYDSF